MANVDVRLAAMTRRVNELERRVGVLAPEVQMRENELEHDRQGFTHDLPSELSLIKPEAQEERCPRCGSRTREGRGLFAKSSLGDVRCVHPFHTPQPEPAKPAFRVGDAVRFLMGNEFAYGRIFRHGVTLALVADNGWTTDIEHYDLTPALGHDRNGTPVFEGDELRHASCAMVYAGFDHELFPIKECFLVKRKEFTT